MKATSWQWLSEAQVARCSGLPAPLVPVLVSGVLGDDGRVRYDEVALMRAQVAAAMLAAGMRWGFVRPAMLQARDFDAEVVRELRDRWCAIAARRRPGLPPAAGLVVGWLVVAAVFVAGILVGAGLL
jgi:hypothetical protein